jgi:hypothetical protein
MSTTKVSTTVTVQAAKAGSPIGFYSAQVTVTDGCENEYHVPLGEEFHARLLGARIGKPVTITLEWEDGE